MRELKQLAHQSRALANVFLHQFAANQPDEAGVGRVGDRLGEQCFPGAGRPNQQDALRGLDSDLEEQVRLGERKLDRAAQFLQLLLQAADVFVGLGWLLEHLGAHD